MKKRNSLLFMLSFTLLTTPFLYGASKKKSKGYFSSFSMPSLSSLNPFGGTQKKKVVLNSDQNQKPRKKKKQKSGIATKASSMRSAIMGAPSALMYSRMAQRLASYVSSKKGKQQIKSVLKTSLYYGIPVVGCAWGVKYYVDGRLQKLQDQQQGQQNQQVPRDTRSQDDQNFSDAVKQGGSQCIEQNCALLRQVKDALDSLQQRTSQTVTNDQIFDLITQMRCEIGNLLNQFGTALNQKAALRGITQAGWDDINIENNFKRFCETGKTGMLSDQASDLRNCGYLSKYQDVDRAVLVNGKDGKSYLCVSFNISKESWSGTIEEEWINKKLVFKKDITDMFVMPNEAHVVLVARDQKTKNWFN